MIAGASIKQIMCVNESSVRWIVGFGFCEVFVLFVVVSSPACTAGQMYAKHALLNRCLESKYHKNIPGPEDALHKQCEPWKGRACCKSSTTLQLHYSSLYNFNYNHCGHIKNMSSECRRHFLQDECFFECSPNIGPWVVRVDLKIRNESFFEVPLCASDCTAWFEACKNDFTCSDNWMNNVKKEGGLTPCISTRECRTFAHIFTTPRNFCEKIWDHSWKYTEDCQPCMRIWFDSSKGNPNDAVTKHYVEKLLSSSSLSILNKGALLLTLVILFSYLYTLQVSC